MSYEEPFAGLEASVLNLHDAIAGLTFVADSAPDRHSMGDLIAEASVELQSHAHRMVSAVGAVRNSTGALNQHGAVRQAVAICQEEYIVLSCALQDNLLRYERMAELATLRRKKGGSWVRWTHEVQQTLEGCREPLLDVQNGLFSCWKAVSTGQVADFATRFNAVS